MDPSETADATAAEAAAAEQQSAAAAAAAEEQQPEPKTTREAIYARAREQREASNAEDPERLAAVSAMAGRPIEEAAPAGDGELQQDIAGDGKKSLALDSRMDTLTVDGQKIERPIEEVLEAGRRTLQKDYSADLKLRQASSTLQLAAEKLASVERREKALENSGGLPSSGARQDDASSRLSEQDAGESTEAIAQAGAEQARNVLFDEGDSEKAGKVILETSRKVVVEDTNRVFKTEFSDITSDPVAFQRAASLMRAELAKNPSVGQIPGIATRIGNQIRSEQQAAREDLKPGAGQQQGKTEATEQQQAAGASDKTTQKMRLPIMPSRAGTKVSDSKPSQVSQRKTPGQIVQDMKRARGQLRE